MEEINKTNDGAAHKAAEKSSRRNMIKLFGAGIVGVVAGGVGLKCCGPISLPQCATSPQQGRLNVVVHGMMIIHVQDDPSKVTNGTMTLVIPKIDDQHAVLAGPLSNLQPLQRGGKYTLNNSNPTEKAYIFDPARQILVRKSYQRDKTMTSVSLNAPSADTVTITMPRPGLYNPFRTVARKFKGNFSTNNYLKTVDFPIGHVLGFTWPDRTAALVGPNTVAVPVRNGYFENFHVFNQNPMGLHASALNVLDGQFTVSGDVNTPNVDIDIYDDPDHPAPDPGCDLESIGMSAADECDLSELSRYGFNYGAEASRVPFSIVDKMTGRDKLLNASDPASCVTYIYDECGSNNPG